MNTIKQQINDLALLCLENSGEHRDYTDEDLGDAGIIFMEVMMSKMCDKHVDKLTHPQLEELGAEMGKSLHLMIKVFTGVDTKTIYKLKK